MLVNSLSGQCLLATQHQGGTPRSERALQIPRLQNIPKCRLSTIVTHMRLGSPNTWFQPGMGPLCTKITVPSLNTKKTLPLYTLCSQTIATRRPVPQVTPSGTIPVATPRLHGPLTGPDQIGNLTASPNFPLQYHHGRQG